MTEETIDALVKKFYTHTLPKAEWTHEAHLTVAYWYLRRYSVEEATCYLRSGIITYNVSIGIENSAFRGYHETLTLFWIHIIHKHIQLNGSENGSEGLLNFLNSVQASKKYPLTFYSREVLFSLPARAFWTEPNLLPLP